MTVRVRALLAPCLLVALMAAGAGPAQPAEPVPPPEVTIEHLGHATFVVESAAGTRLVIDPFNHRLWMGHADPAPPPAADAALVTHPPSDHDAVYYFPDDLTVFRRPGSYAVGDIRFRGIRGRHAGAYGEAVEPANTLWRLEVDDLVIAHLGDNGPLGPEELAALGRVDVLMLPAGGTDHSPMPEATAAILDRLAPKVVIPVRYADPVLAAMEELGSVEPWPESWIGEGKGGVRRLGGSSARFSIASLPAEPTFVVFAPPAGSVPLSERYKKAAAEMDRSFTLLRESDDNLPQAIRHLETAVELAPERITLWSFLAGQLAAAGRLPEAIQALERGLAAVGGADFGSVVHARSRLAEMYLAAGEEELAALQYRQVARSTRHLELRREAEKFLAGRSGR